MSGTCCRPHLRDFWRENPLFRNRNRTGCCTLSTAPARGAAYSRRASNLVASSDYMIDTALAYLISLGILAFGVIWIVEGTNSAPMVLDVAIGVLTVAV